MRVVIHEASTLYEQAKAVRDLEKLDAAIRLLRDAVDELDDRDERRPGVLSTLIDLILETGRWSGRSLPTEDDPIVAEYFRCHDRAVELMDNSTDMSDTTAAENLFRRTLALPIGGAGSALAMGESEQPAAHEIQSRRWRRRPD
ncbi:hypothetical protein ABZ345_00130 [Lentzea sp. NPDC005914]|uniref:hypothetical protein n=1 Tax=Lentzea sp. NPDC005914 TaxID=3154572 RepID=UPI0033FBB3B5